MLETELDYQITRIDNLEDDLDDIDGLLEDLIESIDQLSTDVDDLTDDLAALEEETLNLNISSDVADTAELVLIAIAD